MFWRARNHKVRVVRRAHRIIGAGAAASFLVLGAAAAYAQNRKQPANKRVNELTLARLQPGKDSLAAAEKMFPREQRARSSRSDAPEWGDGCTGRFVRIELRRKLAVESVTVSSLGSSADYDCRVNTPAWFRPRSWRTGRGIGLGSTRKEVLVTYGQPQSSGPGTQNGRALELMFYAFDWAGPDVPQVMEITLERGRVVQITLAFPSL